MTWGRKGALMMLAVVAFWATMPTFACLLGTRHASQSDCCRAMAQTCDSPAKGADGSCCRTQGSNPAVALVPPFSVGNSQNLAVEARQAGLELPAAPGGAYRNAIETPPPEFPPRGAFALRI